jgi:hypothetical protein
VIAVFVSDKHAVETLRVLSHHRKAAHDLLRAQTCVDKHACIACNDQNRVTS